MNGPDGFEERTADSQERSEREHDDIDRIEDRADADLMAIAERRLNSDLAVLL